MSQGKKIEIRSVYVIHKLTEKTGQTLVLADTILILIQLFTFVCIQ